MFAKAAPLPPPPQKKIHRVRLKFFSCSYTGIGLKWFRFFGKTYAYQKRAGNVELNSCTQ